MGLCIIRHTLYSCLIPKYGTVLGGKTHFGEFMICSSLCMLDRELISKDSINQTFLL